MSFRVIFFKLHHESTTVEKTVEGILSQLKSNPKITLRELQNNTGLSRRGIEWNISKLKQEGRIERVGSDKGRYWKVLDKK